MDDKLEAEDGGPQQTNLHATTSALSSDTRQPGNLPLPGSQTVTTAQNLQVVLTGLSTAEPAALTFIFPRPPGAGMDSTQADEPLWDGDFNKHCRKIILTKQLAKQDTPLKICIVA